MLDLGDSVHLAIVVTDSTGAFVDSTLTLTITLPDQTSVTPSYVHDSLGKYHYDYPTVQAGRHTARTVGTNVAFAHTEVFDVEPAADISIVALATVKVQLRITGTDDDDELRGYLLSASENTEKSVGICAARTFTDRCVSYGNTLYLPNVPVLTLTSLTPVYSTAPAVAVSEVVVNLATGEITRVDQQQFFGDYVAQYVAGRAVIQSSIRIFCTMVVQHLWNTRRGAGVIQAGGGELVTLPGWGYAIPERAAQLLAPCRIDQAVLA